MSRQIQRQTFLPLLRTGLFIVVGFTGLTLVSAQSDPNTVEPNEVIKVDTKLVELKVSVLCSDPKSPLPELKMTDFAVREDGKPQPLQFFGTAEAPFDLVLLLDISGSSADKMKLIRQSAEHFLEAARPADRDSVLTFSSVLTLIGPLNLDRDKLRKNVKKIENGMGGTNFWDSLRYVLMHLPDDKSTGRRTAVVVMTDGVDNAIPGERGVGSATKFPELMDYIRGSSALVLPVYLDTEKEMVKKKQYGMTPENYAIARAQLSDIAFAGGGKVYYARQTKDLNGVYEQVIRDLGTVYTLGYEAERELDGSWRKVSVEIPGRPDLTAHTRPGYFAANGRAFVTQDAPVANPPKN